MARSAFTTWGASWSDRDGLVLAHHHAVIVIGDLLRQQPEFFGRLRRFGLAQRILSPLAPLLQLAGSRIGRRKNGNRLEGERLRMLEAGRVLIVVSPDLGRRNRTLYLSTSLFRRASISSERRIFSCSNCCEP